MGVLLNPASPFAEFEDSFYDPQGLLVSWFARGRVFESGATAMSFVVTETTFTPCWSNPVWAQLEYAIGTESTRILQLASSVAFALPPTHNDALALPHPGPLFVASSPFWSKWLYGAVGGATASAMCIACAFATETGRSFLESCWASCMAALGRDVEAAGEPVVDVTPLAGEVYILAGGDEYLAAGARSSQDSASTPARSRARESGD